MKKIFGIGIVIAILFSVTVWGAGTLQVQTNKPQVQTRQVPQLATGKLQLQARCGQYFIDTGTAVNEPSNVCRYLFTQENFQSTYSSFYECKINFPEENLCPAGARMTHRSFGLPAEQTIFYICESDMPISTICAAGFELSGHWGNTFVCEMATPDLAPCAVPGSKLFRVGCLGECGSSSACCGIPK